MRLTLGKLRERTGKQMTMERKALKIAGDIAESAKRAADDLAKAQALRKRTGSHFVRSSWRLRLGQALHCEELVANDSPDRATRMAGPGSESGQRDGRSCGTLPRTRLRSSWRRASRRRLMTMLTSGRPTVAGVNRRRRTQVCRSGQAWSPMTNWRAKLLKAVPHMGTPATMLDPERKLGQGGGRLRHPAADKKDLQTKVEYHVDQRSAEPNLWDIRNASKADGIRKHYLEASESFGDETSFQYNYHSGFGTKINRKLGRWNKSSQRPKTAWEKELMQGARPLRDLAGVKIRTDARKSASQATSTARNGGRNAAICRRCQAMGEASAIPGCDVSWASAGRGDDGLQRSKPNVLGEWRRTSGREATARISCGSELWASAGRGGDGLQRSTFQILGGRTKVSGRFGTARTRVESWDWQSLSNEVRAGAEGGGSELSRSVQFFFVFPREPEWCVFPSCGMWRITFLVSWIWGREKEIFDAFKTCLASLKRHLVILLIQAEVSDFITRKHQLASGNIIKSGSCPTRYRASWNKIPFRPTSGIITWFFQQSRGLSKSQYCFTHQPCIENCWSNTSTGHTRGVSGKSIASVRENRLGIGSLNWFGRGGPHQVYQSRQY